MTYEEDYYEILGVSPGASADETRAGRNRKALTLHPDRMRQATEAERRTAEEELKRVNRAYQTLSTADGRRRYYEGWKHRESPPRPVVEPSTIDLGETQPGETKMASFILRNDGGPYESIWISDPDSWVQLAGYASLRADDELPLNVVIAAAGREWGRDYTESIVVRLDEEETVVKARLRTELAWQPSAAHGSSTAGTATAGATNSPLDLLAAWLGVSAVVAVVIGIIAMIAMNVSSGTSATQTYQTNVPAFQNTQAFRPPTQPGLPSYPQVPGFDAFGTGGQPAVPGFDSFGMRGQPSMPGFDSFGIGSQPNRGGFQPSIPSFQPSAPSRSSVPNFRPSAPSRSAPSFGGSRSGSSNFGGSGFGGSSVPSFSFP